MIPTVLQENAVMILADVPQAVLENRVLMMASVLQENAVILTKNVNQEIAMHM